MGEQQKHMLMSYNTYIPSSQFSTGPSNNTQQWGLKPPKEELVKVELITYNEG